MTAKSQEGQGWSVAGKGARHRAGAAAAQAAAAGSASKGRADHRGANAGKAVARHGGDKGMSSRIRAGELHETRRGVMEAGGPDVLAVVTILAEEASWAAVVTKMGSPSWLVRGRLGANGGALAKDCALLRSLLPGTEIVQAKLLSRGSMMKQLAGQREVCGGKHMLRTLAVQTRGLSPLGAALAVEPAGVLQAAALVAVEYRKEWGSGYGAVSLGSGKVADIGACIAKRRCAHTESTGGATKITRAGWTGWMATAMVWSMTGPIGTTTTVTDTLKKGETAMTPTHPPPLPA